MNFNVRAFSHYRLVVNRTRWLFDVRTADFNVGNSLICSHLSRDNTVIEGNLFEGNRKEEKHKKILTSPLDFG